MKGASNAKGEINPGAENITNTGKSEPISLNNELAKKKAPNVWGRREPAASYQEEGGGHPKPVDANFLCNRESARAQRDGEITH